MPVAVVDVVDVGMVMDNRLVAVPVGMRRLRELLRRVLVLMMLVVGVLVRVLQRLVRVPMLVPVRGEEQGSRGHRREREEAP